MGRLLPLVGFAFLGGCFCWEPDYSNYGARPHEWSLAGPDFEKKVFGPMPLDEVRGFIRDYESGGWEVVGIEPASLPEDLMIHATELDAPTPTGRGWTRDLAKTMDDRVEAPKKAAVLPYLADGVKPHRQKVLVILRRWL